MDLAAIKSLCFEKPADKARFEDYIRTSATIAEVENAVAAIRAADQYKPDGKISETEYGIFSEAAKQLFARQNAKLPGLVTQIVELRKAQEAVIDATSSCQSGCTCGCTC